MDVLWQVVYWGNLIQGSFVTKFFQKYWVSGHFSVASRVKATLRQFLIMIVAGLILIVLAAALAYYLLRDVSHEQFIEYSKTAILVLSNMYGTIVLVTLLSYGLAFLPFQIWKLSNNHQVVFEGLMQAEQMSQSRKDALIEFRKEVKSCRNMVQSQSNDDN